MVLLSLFCFFSKFAVSPIPPDVHLDSVLPVFCLGEVFVSEERAFFWTFPNLISIFIVIVIVFASVTASVFLTEIVELFSWDETVGATDSRCVWAVAANWLLNISPLDPPILNIETNKYSQE